MENIEAVIRNVVRAVIVRDEDVLLLKKRDELGNDYYVLPGGGQDTGETLFQALDRECVEEIATLVEIDRLLYVADYFKERNQSNGAKSIRHLVEFAFLCAVPKSYQAMCGSHPDKHQIDVVWVNLHELDRVTLFPKTLADYLVDLDRMKNSIYVGEIK